ncbi:hypothetical protein HPB50_002304 [Hyalomma asiaticum]|uniref:Uncharacterized protein n=1 Tax=Hyalomma asiaticum TaxID=266040 RepID=A0ACB7SMD2_HYAAI|nr:hypothetical protein HPB50_002304 [Hyalomma asiaticum]
MDVLLEAKSFHVCDRSLAARTIASEAPRLPQGSCLLQDMPTGAASTQVSRTNSKAQLSFDTKSSGRNSPPCNMKGSLPPESIALRVLSKEYDGDRSRCDVVRNAPGKIHATPGTTSCDICEAYSSPHSVKPLDDNERNARTVGSGHWLTPI